MAADQDTPLTITLERIEFRASEDTVKTDLEMVCTQCTGVICDAEADDTLATLVRVALSHLDDCKAFECRFCGRDIYSTSEGWVDPEATDDDAIWRLTCESNQGVITAPHDPKEQRT